MNNMFNTDKYTKLEYNRNTGKMDREWIRYADNTYEPVRRDGNIHRKYHSPNRMTDWWLTRKPQDWHPSDEGADASLNHDYGEHDKPGAKRNKPPTRHNFLFRREDAAKAELFAQPAAAEKGDGAPKPAAPKTSLGKGAGAIRELEEKEKSQGATKPRNSAQDARDLNQLEKAMPRNSVQNAEDLKRAEKEMARKKEDKPLTHADMADARDRMWSGIGKALTKTGQELVTNEDLHKGLEFGSKAAVEVSKDVGKLTLDKATEIVMDALIP
ncbi:hypothetical protein [uncultured Pseudodesulfovibrio sp.]|uniref:hypothetical protein n=1 Tax=uncultured Pseudodesulfovibrio sp. TaxID=2035858 RepID=UPI0029C8790C|nr:hypothetical protein [uncultured Pseudodesulfovibrio sp.]